MGGIRGHHDDWPVIIVIVAILATIAVTQYRKVSAELGAKRRGTDAAPASAAVASPVASR